MDCREIRFAVSDAVPAVAFFALNKVKKPGLGPVGDGVYP
jgi:hypothetical protein